MTRAAKHIIPESRASQSIGIYALPGCMNGCRYAAHCAGRRDHITGVANTAADSCDAYDKYRTDDRRGWDDALSTVPHRVAGARRLHLINTKELH